MVTISRAVETEYLFKIMGNLAAAKSAGDLVAIADCISDLQMIARHSEAAFLAKRASKEAEKAAEVLAELRALRIGYRRAKVATIHATHPANLN